MTIQLPLVMEFILSLTYKCNLACEMCSQYGEGYKDKAPQNEMSYEQWEQFLYSISDVEPKPKLLLMGGEPLLFKDFDKLFLLAQELGFSTQIVTNGTLLDKHLDLISKYDNEVTISIDGFAETHDKIRNVKGTFDKAMSCIQKIQTLQKAGSPMKLCINFVMLPDNIEESDKFLEFIQQYNIHRITFQHLQFSSPELNSKTNEQWKQRLGKEFPQGLISRKQYEITSDYVKKVYSALEKLKQICKINGFIFPALNEQEGLSYYLGENMDEIRKHFICTTPWINPTIHSNGDVSNCIGNIIGNILNEDFWDIWNNEKANLLRESLFEDGKFHICSRCCNFYKGNFLPAKNQIININGKNLLLPSEINFVKSSDVGVFVLDKSRPPENGTIPVIPIDIHSQKQLNKLQESEEILGFFSDIK